MWRWRKVVWRRGEESNEMKEEVNSEVKVVWKRRKWRK